MELNINLQCEMLGYKKEDGVVYYELRVRFMNRIWEIKKRYSEFYLLNECLEKILANLPELPPKTLSPLKQHDDLKARQENLSKYLEVDSS